MRANAAATGLNPSMAGLPDDGRRRAIVEAISPAVDGGRFPVKRVVGDVVVVEADAFADGHDIVSVRLRHHAPGAAAWTEIPMDELGNDRWRSEFRVEALGRHAYTVAAWTNAWATGAVSWLASDLRQQTLLSQRSPRPSCFRWATAPPCPGWTKCPPRCARRYCACALPTPGGLLCSLYLQERNTQPRRTS